MQHRREPRLELGGPILGELVRTTYWARNASSVPRICSSRNDASPNSSIRSFWSGVAVSSSFGRLAQRLPERLPGSVILAVGVPQPVRLVDDHDVPGDPARVCLAGCAANGCEQMTTRRCRTGSSGALAAPARAPSRRRPPRRRGRTSRAAPRATARAASPGTRMRTRVFPSATSWAMHDARLDGLAEAHLVGEHAAAGRQRVERERGRLDLVRVQVDRGVGEGPGEPGGPAAAARRERLGGDPLVERRELGLVRSRARRHVRHATHPASPTVPRRCGSAALRRAGASALAPLRPAATPRAARASRQTAVSLRPSAL